MVVGGEARADRARPAATRRTGRSHAACTRRVRDRRASAGCRRCRCPTSTGASRSGRRSWRRAIASIVIIMSATAGAVTCVSRRCPSGRSKSSVSIVRALRPELPVGLVDDLERGDATCGRVAVPEPLARSRAHALPGPMPSGGSRYRRSFYVWSRARARAPVDVLRRAARRGPGVRNRQSAHAGGDAARSRSPSADSDTATRMICMPSACAGVDLARRARRATARRVVAVAGRLVGDRAGPRASPPRAAAGSSSRAAPATTAAGAGCGSRSAG